MPEHRDLTGAELHEPKGADDVATENKMHYLADGAGSGVWKHGGGSVHGEMTIVGNATPEVIPTAVDATLSTDTDYTKIITGWTAGHEELITFSTDKLVCAVDGSYEVHFWCDILFPTANQRVGIKYSINDGTPYSVRKLITVSASTGDTLNLAGSGVLSGLSAGDSISMYIASDKAGDLTVEEAGLFVKLLDQD